LQIRDVQLLYVYLVRENAMSGLIILLFSFPYKVNEFIINLYLKVVLRLFPSRAPRSRVEADNLPSSTRKSAPHSYYHNRCSRNYYFPGRRGRDWFIFERIKL